MTKEGHLHSGSIQRIATGNYHFIFLDLLQLPLYLYLTGKHFLLRLIMMLGVFTHYRYSKNFFYALTF